MGDGRLSVQDWLPGLEPGSQGVLAARAKPSRGSSRSGPKPPTVERLVEKAAPRARKLFERLRAELLREPGVGEGVQYDESSGSFSPSYAFRERELVRVQLDPVLAATVTLDHGDRQLAALLQASGLSDAFKTQAIKCARRSGKRIFLAFLVRNDGELASLATLVRERIALETAAAT